ncbi:hypothetical protein NPX13_g9289 [Xylaria arbuscula]|uniref:Uncharacterized protein n=1 Tax=Xylaria arbuscula TaxID=114810 RepID=A0A9W8TIL4_9PEZI|nr:hypothetical protein NPX13_g9289 [Xylaria arbuscula]
MLSEASLLTQPLDGAKTDRVSGFSPMSGDAEYLCTSALTKPMAFLVDPDISTADVYTTLAPELSIVHDQITVQWEHSDLGQFPVNVASQYKFMMGVAVQANTAEETVPSSTHHRGHNGDTSTTVIWPTSHYGATSTTETQTRSTTETQTHSTTEARVEPTTTAPTTGATTATPTATTTNSSPKLNKSIVSVVICFALAACIMA